MTNKKIIAIGMALVMIAAGFTACGKNDTITEEGNPTDSAVEAIADNETNEPDAPANSDSETLNAQENKQNDAPATGKSDKTNTNDGDKNEIPVNNTPTTTKKSNQNSVTTKKNETPTKAPTTTKKPETTTKAPTTTQPQVHYLTYAEVKECVAEAERYAISKGYKINKNKTTAHSSFFMGADTRVWTTKSSYLQYLKDDIDIRYDEIVKEFGFFPDGATLNIYIEGPDELPRWSPNLTTNPDGTPRYVAFVCI